MSVNRVLLVAAPAALVLWIGASAQAISPISQDKCPFPSDAAGELSNALCNQGVDVASLVEKDCEKLCKELEKTCRNDAKMAEDCLEIDDKFWTKLQDGLCKANNPDDKDARKACQDGVKDDDKACKEARKTEKDDGKTNCAESFGKESGCVEACLANGFPFGPGCGL